MNEFKYKHLFEPIQLAGTLFRNRIFAAPTGFRITATDSVLPTEAAYYYGRKAMGGAASVSTGELIVDGKNGRAHPEDICIEEPLALLSFAKVANEISRYGSVPTAELQHAGMYANRELSILGGEIKTAIEILSIAVFFVSHYSQKAARLMLIPIGQVFG